MTEEEEKYLRFYLINTAKIADKSEFERWCQQHLQRPDGEEEFKHTLDLAKEFAAGYRKGWNAFKDQLQQAWNAKPDAPPPPWSVEIKD